MAMSDRNTTDPATASVPELPAMPVGATQLLTTEDERSIASYLLPEAVETAPSIATNSGDNNAQALSQPRSKAVAFDPCIHVRWHVHAFIDGKGLYKGFVKHISLEGTDIFLDLNLQKVKSIKLCIFVPPLSKTSPPRVMEVSAKVVRTFLDSHESIFRAGVKFTQFNLASDQAYLQSRIEGRIFNLA
jgi:hypothetical protein